MAKEKTKDIFEEGEKVENNFVQWGKTGDWVKGTLIGVREVVNQLKGDGSKQKIYELKAEVGSFHPINEDKSVSDKTREIESGSFWSIGGKTGVDAQMRNIVVGRVIGMKFVDILPSKQKGYSPTKVIEVRTWGVDPEYAEKKEDDGFGDFGNNK